MHKLGPVAFITYFSTKPLINFSVGHGDSVCNLAFSTDGQLLASGCLGGLIQIWDIQSGNLKCSLEGPGMGIEVNLLCTFKNIILCSHLLKIDYEFPSQWIRWHPRGHLVLAGSEDSTIWMWNADKGACINTFSGHGGSVTCGDFTPDGIYLLFFLVIFG